GGDLLVDGRLLLLGRAADVSDGWDELRHWARTPVVPVEGRKGGGWPRRVRLTRPRLGNYSGRCRPSTIVSEGNVVVVVVGGDRAGLDEFLKEGLIPREALGVVPEFNPRLRVIAVVGAAGGAQVFVAVYAGQVRRARVRDRGCVGAR